MRELTVNQFRSNLRESVEQAVQNHEPLRVTRRGGEDFVVVAAADWEREQETLYVLQNQSLMAQIGRSLETSRQGKGVIPADSEL
ncbi:MAG: type II toxin-antitoxin system Phd/YefM family antitoxin [Sulfurimicrobium sp.]|nr:type II toxin-antitoxin system Phd/YefM family antitoxin [Sulfurimicrobium sp.]